MPLKKFSTAQLLHASSNKAFWVVSHTHEISPKINFDKREIICILYFFLDQIGELLKEKFDNAHEVQQKKKRGRRMLLSR